MVAQVTGAASSNHTLARWDIAGADLGHSFWYRGSLYMVFGDTFGPSSTNWRSNTMARIDSPRPASGLRFTTMLTARGGGGAAELLGSLKVAGIEQTVIPTNGIAVGDRMYLHYMSVRQWVIPGRWTINYSGLAYSDDGGRTWVKDPVTRWGADSNFGQVAFVRSGGYVYLFGIAAGRFGGVALARVAPSQMLDPEAYRYWSGRAWARSRAAATVVTAPVGELSVRWSAFAHRWLMMYLDESRAAIVLRSASSLTGPWSAEQVVTTAAQYPELYAPYMLPMDTGSKVYFTMSQFGSYEVYLMRTSLTLGR